MQELRLRFNSLLEQTPVRFYRYLHNSIDWDARIFSIIGARGTGKTTLLLQHIKKNLDIKKTLFVNADDFYFSENKLFHLAEEFSNYGGRHLFVDEIHKYKDWSKEVKMIYDYLPGLQLIFTGSSILEIYKGQADLSRRVLSFYMHGLSFREYLNLKFNKDYKPFSLDDILGQKVKIEEKPLPLFKEYLKEGYYPFFIEKNYTERLRNVINLTLEVDIPAYTDMNVSTTRKLKQLLYIIARSVPFKPNFTKIGEQMGIHRNQVGDYLEYLERAGLINRLMESAGNLGGLGKVNKVYLNNSNLGHVIAAENQNTGNERETFFYNQLNPFFEVTASKYADFQIGDMTFEIGGKHKKQSQIKNTEKGYIVKDDIVYGIDNIIPLWCFGFIY